MLWNEGEDRPYSFLDYPVGLKVRAYREGLDWMEGQDPYAACLCSMHYETLTRRFGGSEEEARFAEGESARQERLRAGMSGEELENLDRNLRFLRLCDGLSLFVCLNEPGGSGYAPPYPGGFEFDGTSFDPVWEGDDILRFDPNPFTGSFEIALPYKEVGKDRRDLGEGVLRFRISG